MPDPATKHHSRAGDSNTTVGSHGNAVSITPRLKTSEVNNQSPILQGNTADLLCQSAKPKRATSLVDIDPRAFEIEHESMNEQERHCCAFPVSFYPVPPGLPQPCEMVIKPQVSVVPYAELKPTPQPPTIHDILFEKLAALETPSTINRSRQQRNNSLDCFPVVAEDDGAVP